MINRLRREFFQVTDEGGIQRVIANLRIEPIHTAPEDARILLLIFPDEDLERLIEQSHGIDIGSRHGLGALRGHFLGKISRVGIARHNGPPGGRKDFFVKTVRIAGSAGNVDIRHIFTFL